MFCTYWAAGNPEGKTQFGRPKPRSEDNIKPDAMQIVGFVLAGLICLKIGFSDRIFKYGKTFKFRRREGIC
jgi:hypothetical protein